MRLLNPISAALAILTLSAEAKPRDAILLSQVESLTLRADRQTTHNRAPAAPQLKCISPPAICALHSVDLMRCDNRGAGYDGEEDIQWTCAAQLPPELKLGSTDVVCEGYASPDDPYVLKGSCGVEYRVVLTREGEERWPGLAGEGGGAGGGGGGGAGDWFPVLFWVIFIAVLGYIVYGALTGPGGGDGQHRAGNGRFGGGGGDGGGGGGGGPWGGDDGWDDPPPPYPGSNNDNNRRTQSKRSGRAAGQQQGWRPDARSAGLGAAAGAAAGYGIGRMGNNSSRSNYGSTWGGGGNGGEGSSRSNSSTSSSSRYESTGFGSTSRR